MPTQTSASESAHPSQWDLCSISDEELGGDSVVATLFRAVLKGEESCAVRERTTKSTSHSSEQSNVPWSQPHTVLCFKHANSLHYGQHVSYRWHYILYSYNKKGTILVHVIQWCTTLVTVCQLEILTMTASSFRWSTGIQYYLDADWLTSFVCVQNTTKPIRKSSSKTEQTNTESNSIQQFQY